MPWHQQVTLLKKKEIKGNAINLCRRTANCF